MLDRVKTVLVVVVVVVVVVVGVVVVVVVLMLVLAITVAASVLCLIDNLLSQHASTRSEVNTAVIYEGSVRQRCCAISLFRHFESSGRSQCLRVLNSEHHFTVLLRKVSNCIHNDTA
jgi:hypothetical protein